MGCPCKIPIEQYPESADWGPLFWKLIHKLSLLAGKQSVVLLRGDEVRTWIHVIRELRDTIPCDICRAHYTKWIGEHPPEQLLTMPYSDVAGWVQNYFWELHNEINEGNDRGLFLFSDLSVVYGSVHISATWRALEPVMKKVITLNGVRLLSWKKWLGYVRTLQGLYGV